MTLFLIFADNMENKEKKTMHREPSYKAAVKFILKSVYWLKLFFWLKVENEENASFIEKLLTVTPLNATYFKKRVCNTYVGDSYRYWN